MEYTINCNNSMGLTQEEFVPLKIDSSPCNCLGKRIFDVLPKVNLVIFFGFDFLPKLVLVNLTPLLILHRRYDSICIRHKSTYWQSEKYGIYFLKSLPFPRNQDSVGERDRTRYREIKCDAMPASGNASACQHSSVFMQA